MEFEGVLFWDTPDLPQIEYSDEDQYIQLTAEEAKRIDLVAFRAYGDSELDWIILLANNIDLPNQIVEGQLIRIPARATINRVLAKAEDVVS
jgi:hypothetical protein